VSGSRRNWPQLLRILLKAGWSEAGLAHVADVSVERVKEYLSGIREPETRVALEFDKILSSHRRAGLELVVPPKEAIAEIPPDGPAPQNKPSRGVYEDPLVPAHYHGYRAIAEDGTLMVELRFHERMEERDVVPGLRAWLNRGDPVIKMVSS
jgi:hypothetical protein